MDAVSHSLVDIVPWLKTTHNMCIVHYAYVSKIDNEYAHAHELDAEYFGRIDHTASYI